MLFTIFFLIDLITKTSLGRMSRGRDDCSTICQPERDSGTSRNVLL
jgi:hypothetical protein